MVGVEGFELSTSCSQSKRATGLRHTPNLRNFTEPDTWWSIEELHAASKTGQRRVSVKANAGCIGTKTSSRNHTP
jgi:hypothetical protein